MADLIILGTVFVAISFIFFVIFHLAFSRNLLRGRLEQISGIHEHKESASTKFNFFAGIIKYLGRFGSPKEEGRLSGTKMALYRAGYRGGNDQVLFFGIKTFLTIFFLVIACVLFSYFSNFTNIQIMLYTLLAAAAGFYLPALWIYFKAKGRTEQIRNGFPDLLDLLIICMGAGQGLDAALDRVGKEINTTNPILGQEFRLLNLEIRAGKSRKEALRNMADRTSVDDIFSLVALVNQSEEMGVSITQTLRIHSDSMRTKRQLRAEAIAARIPVKLAIPLILFIFPCLMVIIIGPGVISILRAFIGME
jgi:tight adherence protein C